MMDDKQRIQALKEIVFEKKESSLIEKLELIRDIDTESHFNNFILTCAIIIEISENYSESASSLLLRKIYHDKFFLKEDTAKHRLRYGKLFLKVLGEKAIFPYMRTSNVIRRLINSIIYGQATDIRDVVSITPHRSLMELNVELLKKYLLSGNVNIEDALMLSYNCVAAISMDDQKVTISSEAVTILEPYLRENFELYLSIFIRPYYTSASDDFPGIAMHVPEPFYSQIFSGHGRFLDLLKNYARQDKIDEKLTKDIVSFMDSYEKRGYKPVILPSDISYGLHKNAREIKARQ